jgi:hypothetical protein
MRRFILPSVLLLACFAGCEGVSGPRQHRADPTQIDDPRLSIAQQEARGRDRLALPDPTSILPGGKNANNDAGLMPGPVGR